MLLGRSTREWKQKGDSWWWMTLGYSFFHCLLMALFILVTILTPLRTQPGFVVCVCMCVAAVLVYVHMCACCGGPESALSVILMVQSISFLRWGFSLSWNSSGRPNWLAREPQRSTCLCLPSSGIASMCHHAWFLCRCWGSNLCLWGTIYRLNNCLSSLRWF
jgi:hypothetical protein